MDGQQWKVKQESGLLSITPRPLALDVLAAECDNLLARMQTDEARMRMRAAFGESPDELGRAAIEAARRLR